LYTFRSFSEANEKEVKITNKALVKLGDRLCQMIEAESPSRRVKAWVFSRGGADFVVEVSEDSKVLRRSPAGAASWVVKPDDRLQLIGSGLAASFGFVQQAPKPKSSPDERWLGRLAPLPDQELWLALPQVKRNALRKESESRFFNSASARLVGWRAIQTDHLQVLSQATKGCRRRPRSA